LGETNALGDVLSKVRAELENEKKKLEAERDARQQENVRHQQELQQLREQAEKNKELLDADQKSLGDVTKTIQQSEALEPEPSEADAEKQKPAELRMAFSTGELAVERPLLTTRILPTEVEQPQPETRPPEVQPPTEDQEAKRKHENDIREGLEEQARQNEELRKEIQAKVTDEFTAIRTEIQRLREQVSREQDVLDTKRRDLDLERSRLEEERRALQARISDTFTATRAELDRLREQVSRKQEEIEIKQKEVYEEKIKVDEEKRLLKERATEAEAERLRFMTRKMMTELQNERSELARLKTSLQQLRSESAHDRKRLERDRNAILRARVSLENQKRKTAWKKALLEIKARRAMLSQKPLRTVDKPKETGKKTSETVQLAPASTMSTDEEAVVLGVRLGDQTYGINIGSVREIMKRQPITPLPRQPPYVEGVMNVRGIIIPVVNLRKRFDLKGETSGEPHTVIIDSPQGMVGILVDSVSEVIRLPHDRITPAPPIASGFDGQYLRGICRVGDELLLYLDVERLIQKATPISMLQRGPAAQTGKWALSEDEQKLLTIIPVTGIMKSRLKKKTKFSDTRLDKAISSIGRKGLVKVHREGRQRVISRTPRAVPTG
jgi:purine-binding chemotaxis protein CheW